LKYDALYPDPAKLTVLANNHDTPRFLSLDGADLGGAMLHTAFILSVRRIPQLYYGEEIAMEGGEDPDNRRDFPVSAFQAAERKGKARQMFDWTREWIRLRREHSAIRRGRLIDLVYDDNVYVFARQDNTETVVIAINRQNKEQEVNIPFKSIVPLIGKIRVSTGETGITLPANSAVAFRAS
ncbi:MAG TPA: alpha-amylase family glycosyl hydrolase, partial [Pyrinomonadaceae bacterium]|nr:alpha-amylase family glycosyl hydrolase [Pyrinomonadaceae bacterium]